MKVEYKKILGDQFKYSCREIMELAVPVSVAGKIAESLKHITELQAEFDVARLAIVSKYGERDANNELKTEGEGIHEAYVIKPKDKAKYEKEFNTLLNQEVTVNPIPLSLLGDLIVKPRTLAPLMQIVFA